MALFDRGGSGQDVQDYDPLFYRGRTPVLGAEVELKTSGELPGQFPSAGPAPPTPPSGVGAPPTPPGSFGNFSFPGFNFDFGGLEFPEPPTAPGGAPSGLFGPGAQQGSPLTAGLDVLDRVGSGFNKLRQLGQAPAEGGLLWTSTPSDFSLTAPGDQPWSSLASDANKFSLGGDPNAPTLDPSQFSLGGGDAAANAAQSGINWTGAGAGALQAAGGIAGLATQDPGKPGFIGAGINTAAGAASAASALGLLGSGSGAALGAAAGPAGLALTAPLVLGPALREGVSALSGHDLPQWPAGYVPVNDQMAVDPNTGALLQYHGKGRYGWADQTQQGNRATTAQLLQWGVAPTGELAQQPGYGQDFMAQLTQKAGASGTADIGLRQPSVQSNPAVAPQLTPGIAAEINAGGSRDVPSGLQGSVIRMGDFLVPASVFKTLTDPWGMLARGEAIPGAIWSPVGERGGGGG